MCHNLISINPLKKSKSAPSLKKIQTENNSALAQLTKKLITYDEEYHLNDRSDELIELYESFKNAILALSPVLEISPKKLYIAFKQAEKNFAAIHLQNKALKIWLNAKKGNLDDPKQLAKDVSNVGHWATGDYELIVNDTKNLEYIMSLIKQLL